MNDHDRLRQLHDAVVGNGAEGLVERQKRLEDKLDKHMSWHIAQRGTIVLALGGWTAALITAGLLIFGDS